MMNATLTLDLTRMQRRALRRRVDLCCDVIARHWDCPVVHHVTEISSCGLRLERSSALDVDETVIVSFDLPWTVVGRRIDVFARVARVDRARSVVGLEFLDIDPSDAESLDDFAWDATPSS